MKKQIFRKNIMAGLVICGLLCLTLSESYAFGENGCKVIPDKQKGDCKKNTEGSYNCIPACCFLDCTSSLEISLGVINSFRNSRLVSFDLN